VKLDQRLVRGVASTPLKQAILTGLQHFSARTGCRLIAEGIESLDDWALLRDLDIRLAQGYLLGVPQTATKLKGRTWVGSGRARVPMRSLSRTG
jgi:EAL domain-containing protein (putative c-di-GMP-specific phosphodiesterase class I)